MTVPPGHFPGSSFEFEYTVGGAAPPAPAPYTPYAPAPAPYAPPRPAATAPGTLMRVTVPQGVGPGSILTVNVPGRGAHRVTVPQGTYAGQSFQFRVQ